MKKPKTEQTSNNKDETLKWTFLIFAFLMVLYLVQIRIWDMTSKVNKPANAIDLEVKTPLKQEKWLIRREHAVCPFDANEFNVMDPFQGFKNC